MIKIRVYCVSCNKELWQGLTDKEKAVAIMDGQAENIECADCIMRGIEERRSHEENS